MTFDRNRSLIISYLALRRMIGLLAVALPIVVVAGGISQEGFRIQGSISGYYYTNMRDILVGMLSVVALFLISYRGYDAIDDVVGNMSGVFALGMLIFPTSPYSGTIQKVGVFLVNDDISAYFHLAFAALFFLSLSFFSLFLFTRRGPRPGPLGREKKRRNILYRTCGTVMILSIVGMLVYTAGYRDTPIARYDPLLFLESIALFAFGISWLVKGNTLFKDKVRIA